MTKTIIPAVCLGLFAATFYPATILAQPRSGDVFREYRWRPEGKWQRVTGPDVEDDRAKAHLPNAVNRIVIDDLHLARRVEACIEMLLCHGGTVGEKIRVGDGPWIDIPEPELIPGESGQGPPDSEYQYMRYPIVPIPLDQIREGENRFEFTCSRGSALGGWWPQWLLYGVTFRVYYDPTKPHATGEIVSPAPGSVLGDRPRFVVRAAGPKPIRRVDFVGLYEDFNWEGDGNYRQWHGRYLYGRLHNHIGTATAEPYEVAWDTTWIPTQEEPIEVAARIVDRGGVCFVTQAVEGLRLARPYSVRMYKPYDVPRQWSTRAGNRHECKVNVEDDLTGAVAAKVVMVTWNGVAADAIGIGEAKVVGNLGKNHNLSHDEFPVALRLIRSGANTLFTSSATTHHGIEVQWPGMVLMIRYEKPDQFSAP